MSDCMKALVGGGSLEATSSTCCATLASGALLDLLSEDDTDALLRDGG